MNRRVVITGMAINTPLSDTLDGYLEALLAGRSAIGHWRGFDTSVIESKIGGDLSDYDIGARVGGLINALPEALWTRLRLLIKKGAWSTRLSLLLALDAFRDAGLLRGLRDGVPPLDRELATVVGGHNLNANYMYEARTEFEKEPEWIDVMLTVKRQDTDHAARVSELLGAAGPAYTVGGACASGNQALRLAFDEIRYRGYARVLCLGPVLDYNPLDLHAMGLLGAISRFTFDETPERASRPFDLRREGFVPSHGGACLVLEELESARRREAPIYAEVLGVEASSSANHRPIPDEDGQVALLDRLFDRSGVDPVEVDYVNCHATSTPRGDLAEARALRRIFGKRYAGEPLINAPKSMLGHTCWSSALCEIVGAVLQMRAKTLHPTINVEQRDPQIDFEICDGGAVELDARTTLKSAFGFGGINCVALLRRFEA
jgi:3-oxoacyl-(acyl-carrier-protein) synthase